MCYGFLVKEINYKNKENEVINGLTIKRQLNCDYVEWPCCNLKCRIVC